MVTLIDVDATWVNPATVDYDAGEVRRADAAGYVYPGIVRTSDTVGTVTVDGSDVVTVAPFRWAISGEDAVAGTGYYRGGIASAVSAALTARDATNARIDVAVVRQLDTDVVGSHAAYTGRIEVITGDPAAVPGIPALPTMYVELARITVPAEGGGAATVDLTHRTYACAPGGELMVPSAARLPVTAPKWQRARALDTGVPYAWDGTEWVGGSGWTAYTPVWRNGTGGTALSVGNGTLTGAWRLDEGGTVHFRERLVRGSTTNLGSTFWTFSLPVAPKAGTRPIGAAVVINAGAAIPCTWSSVIASPSEVIVADAAGNISATNVASWDAGDEVVITGAYEPA